MRSDEPSLLSGLSFKLAPITILARKSSCVNARGIPPATYQVFHLPSYPEEGVPHLWPGGTHLWMWGTSPLTGGYPSLDGGTPSLWTWPGLPTPHPQLAGVTPLQVWIDWKHYLPHPSDAGGNKVKYASSTIYDSSQKLPLHAYNFTQ